MSFHEFHYRWEWHLRSTPEAIWPLVTDTNRFNRDIGVPELQRQNDAARLEGQSTGRDVIISSSVRSDPEVSAWLANAHHADVEPLEATLKGFDLETFTLWRVSAPTA